jgi:hypothetical protein
VDSFYDWPVLDRLQRQDRLITEDNLDGLIPGEGAAFVMLAPTGGYRQAPPAAHVLDVGTGVEPHALGAEEPCLAAGYTAAMNAALAPLRDARRRSNFWVTDLTHEAYKVKEFQILVARFGDVLGSETILMTPNREYGDVGAATLPLFWTLALEAWQKGYARDRAAVMLAGSDAGPRGATLMEAA